MDELANIGIPTYVRRLAIVQAKIKEIYRILGYLEQPFVNAAFVFDVYAYQLQNSSTSLDWYNLLEVNLS